MRIEKEGEKRKRMRESKRECLESEPEGGKKLYWGDREERPAVIFLQLSVVVYLSTAII